MDPRDILDKTRQAISDCAENDTDKWFYANRFVFARLQLDERKTKTQVKRKLLAAGGPCHYCQKAIDNKVGVPLHRLDSERGYSDDNCVLMHTECHIKYHAENPRSRSAHNGSTRKGTVSASPTLEKASKRYEGQSFTYWWDISPGFLEKIDRYEAVEFVKRDTGERCHMPISAIKSYLIKERQTSRGKGNWGIRILKDREGELAFEPAKKNDSWLFLPVVWLNDPDEDLNNGR